MPIQVSVTSEGNGREGSPYFIPGVTGEESHHGTDLGRLGFIPKDTLGGLCSYYSNIIDTGESVSSVVTRKDIIKTIIARCQEILKDAIEAFEIDQIESINKFTIFGEHIKQIWAYREYLSDSFKEVIVHLLAATRSSHYKAFNKEQYEVIKLVLESIHNLNIDKSHVKNAILLLADKNIDLFAPIRNWDDYIIEVRKRDER